MNALIFLAVLVILIFIHELGHFLAARAVGIKVEEFGLGFPPRLLARRRGDTIYSLNALPLGGFVKLAGEFDRSEEAHAFQNASVWRRIVVVLAGVIMNLFLAWVIFAVGFGFGLPAVTQDLTSYPGSTIVKTEIFVGDVGINTAASRAGLQPGDTLVSGTGRDKFTNATDFQAYTKGHVGQAVNLQIERRGQRLDLPVTLGQGEAPLGVSIGADVRVRLPPLSSLRAATVEVWGITKGIGLTLWRLITSPLKSRVAEDLSGPVGIYQATSAAAQAGGGVVVVLMALLSVNLAVLNILPIPALDGGRLFFLIIEAVARRRVIREEIEAAVSSLGFILLIGLLILLTVRDIIRL